MIAITMSRAGKVIERREYPDKKDLTLDHVAELLAPMFLEWLNKARQNNMVACPPTKP